MQKHVVWTFRLPTLSLFLLLAANSLAHGLRTDLAITQYSHSGWATGNGLSADTIRSIAQTDDGHIWLATSAGLSRFNGTHFQTLNSVNTPELEVDSITTLLKGRHGSLWIGTDGGGLLNYDGIHFKVFTIDDGLSDNSITALAQEGNGKIWILTPVNLQVLDHGKFTSAPIQNALSIFADQRGVLIGTRNGFSIIQDGKIIQYPENAVTALYRNRKGEIWLGVRGKGLCRLQDGKIVPVLQTEEIRSILEDRDGAVWLGTQHGIRRLYKNSPLHPYIHAAVTMLFEDREGVVWAATSGEGLHCFRPSAFVMFSSEEGMSNPRTWCVLQDRARAFWIGTDDGVSRLNDGEFTNYSIPSPVKTIAEDPQGVLWLGTPSGIMRKNGESFSMTIPGVVATSLIAHKDGSLWIGAADGLRRFINGKLLKICGDRITSLYFDQQDELWVGTDTGLKRWTDDGLLDSVISGAISCIYQDSNGNLWVGSYQVLHCLRKGKLTSYRLGTGSNKTLGTEILEDEKGYLWIGTGEGIIRSSLENGQIVSIPFSSAQGLNSPECANGKPAAYKSMDGRFWFATVNGLAEIDPGNYFVNKIAPTVTVEQVMVDRVQVPKFRERNLKFPAGTTRIEFQYAGLSSFSHVSYRYVMQGFDQFWTNAGGQTRTIYTNLPPGKYRFKVLACNQDGVWNIKGDSVSFEIESAAFHFSEKLIVFPLGAAICGFLAGWLLGKFKGGRPA